MEISEFLSQLESDPKNLKLFTSIQETLLAEGTPDDLTEFLTGFFALLGDDPGVETFLIQVGHKARTLKDEARTNALYTFLGKHYLDKLGNREKAEIYLRNVIVTDLNREYLTSFYVDFYSEKENWRRLEEFLTANMPVADGQNRDVEVKRYLAEVAELKNRPEKAVAFLQAAWQADESNLQVAGELKRLFREIGKWHSLIDLLDKEIAALPKSARDERTRLSIEVADIYRDHVNSDTKAVAVYQSILDVDPANLAIIDTLAALYTKLQRWADLVQVLRAKHDATDDVEARLAILMEIGAILVEKYAKTAEAVAVYEEVLAVKPDHREALAKIKDIYDKRRDYERLVEVMRRELDLLPDPKERFAGLVELAKMANERVRKVETLIALWEDVLAGDEASFEAIDNLEKLYERQKEFDKLAAILERQAELFDEPAKQLLILDKLATVRSVRLKDDDGTIAAYRRILEVEPGNRKAVGELKKIYLARSAWADLEWLYRHHGTLGDLLRVLESRVTTMETPAEKVGLLFTIARIYLDELDQKPRAVHTMEQVLEIDPQNADAAGRLVPIYRETADWAKLIDVLRIMLGHTGDAAGLQALHVEIATILEQHLANPQDAFYHWADAFRLDWSNAEVRAALYRLADVTGQHEALVLALEESLDAVDDEAVLLDFTRDVAHLYDERLGKAEEALSYYAKVLDLASDDHDTLVRVERIHRAAGNHAALADILARRVPLAESAALRRELLLQLGALRDEHLDDLDAAIKAYADVLAEFPSDLETLDRLTVLYLKGDRWEALKGNLEAKLVLMQEAGEVSGTRVAEIHKFLGMLAYGQADDAAGAVDAYERALQADPGRADVVQLLEQLVAVAGLRRRIAEILEPVYEMTENWERLADAYGLILKQTRKKEDKLTLLFKRGELFRARLGRPADAYACLAEYFDANPANDAVRLTLFDLAGELDRVEDLVGAFEQKLKEATNPDVVVELSYLLARAYTEKVGDAETGARYFKDVLDLRPDHARSLDALEAIYQGQGRFQDLIEIYRKKAELATDDEQRLAFLFRLARVTYEHLKDGDEAIRILGQVLELDPQSLEAWRFLDRVYLEASAWDKLKETLEKIVPLLADQPAERLDVLKRLAALLEVQLAQPAEAVQVFTRILDLEPGNEYVYGELERFFSEDKEVPAVLDILEPHYVETDRWQPLIAVLERRVALTDSVADKVLLNYRVAHVYAAHNDAESAFLHYGEALTLDPNNPDTLDHLDAIVEGQTGDAKALADLLDSVAGRIDQVDVLRRVLRRVGDLSADVLDDNERAIRYYQRTIEIDPEALDVVDRLALLLRTAERWADLTDVLTRKADLVSDPAEQRSLLLEVGRITRDVLKKADDAIAVYERIYGAFPDERAALEALQALFTDTERWDRLVWTYDEALKAATDDDEKRRCLYEKATLFEQFLEEPESAILTYLELQDLDPTDATALEKLDDLYTRKGDWPSVIDVLERRKPLVEPRAAMEAEFRIGRIRFEELGDAEAAVERYARVLDSDDLREQAVDALRDVFTETDLKELVFDILAPRFSTAGRWTDLVALHEHLVETREAPATQREHLDEIARIQEDQIHDADAAFDARARCLALDPAATDVVEALVAFARRAERLEKLVETLQHLVEGADDPDTARALRRQVALVLKNEVGDFARAIAYDTASLEAFPQDMWFLHELDELYALTDDHESLALVLEQEIELTAEVGPRVELLFRKGELAEGHLKDLDLAFEAYRDVLSLEPANGRAVQALRGIFEAGHRRVEAAHLLEPHYTEIEDWDGLLFILIQKLGDVTDADERFEACLRIGAIYEDRKGDAAEAMRWLGEGFLLRPYDLDLEGRLDRFASQADAWAQEAAILLGAADQSEDDKDRRIELTKKAARLYEERLSDEAEALRWYLAVHALDAAEAEALDAMARLYERAQRWQELADTLEKRVGTDLPDDERVELLLTLARLRVDRLDSLDDAKATYRRVLEIDDHQRAALTALAEIYEVEDAHEDRFRVLEALYEVSGTDDERVGHLKTMARLLVDQLKRPDEAVRLLEEVSTLAPSDLDALHLLQSLLSDAENWARLVEVYQAELQVAELDDGRRAAVNKEVARLAFQLLDDPFQAQEAMERALALTPGDREAVQFLRKVYRENAQFEKLRDTVQSLLDTADDTERTALYEELGEIYTDYLHDPNSAIATWNKLLDLDERSEAAITSLERLFREEQRWADYVGVLEKKLALLEDADDLKLTLMDIGGTWLDRLGEWEKAAATFERLLDLDPTDDEGYGRLERIYEERGRFDELARLLERKLGVTESKDDKIQLYDRLGRIHDEKRLDRDAALAAYKSAFQLDKTNVQIVDEIEKIATAAERWEELYGIYRTLVEEGDEDRRVDALLKAARLAADQLSNADDAVELYERILTLDPEHETALRALHEIFSVNELWRDLARVTKKLSEVTLDPLEKLQLQNDVARLYEEKINDREAAVREYRATLEIDEVDQVALTALERIFRASDDTPALIEILGRKGSLQPEHEADLKMEIGALYEKKLKDPAKAVATYEDVLMYHPQHKAALERLEVLYGEAEDWKNLAEVFERLLFVADDPQERLRVCQNLAVLQETEFHSKESAIEYYLKIREIDPAEADAIKNLDRLYRELEQWEDAAQLYRERLERATDPTEQEHLHRELAGFYLDKLYDLDRGIRELRALLELVPGDDAVAEQLEGIFAREEMWEDLVELLQVLADRATDDADRIDLLYRKAEIIGERLYRQDDVIGVLDRIVGIDASQTRALEMLGDIYRERDEVKPYLERLAAALDRVSSDLANAWIHTAIGVILDQKLNDADEAIEHLETALTFMPDYVDAIEPLAEIYVRKERWEAAEPLLNLLLRRYEESQDQGKQCELFYRIGRAAENLMDTERALVFYKKATAIQPTFAQALFGLARLNYKKGYLDQAERFYNEALEQPDVDVPMEEKIQIYKALGDIALKQGNADKAGRYLQQVVDYHPDSEDVLQDLATFFELHGDWDNYIRYRRDLAALKKDPMERVELMLSIGDTYKEKLGRIDAAIDAYREVIALDPAGRAPYLRLVQLYVETQRFEEAVEVLEDMNRGEQDAERRAMNYMMAAELYRAKLDMPLEAIGFYNKALDQAPTKLEAFRAIDEILTRAKSWKELEENYLHMVKRVRGSSGMEAVEFMLYKNLGEIYRSRLKSHDYAVSAYQLAAKLRPTDVQVHEILADLYEKLGKFDQSIEEHRGLIVASPGRVESYRTLFRLFNDSKQYDKAWCMAGILNLLKQATEQEANFYRQSRAVTLTSAKRPLEAIDVRENIFFQGENAMIGEVFQILYQVIGSRLKGRDLKDFNLKKKHAVDLDRTNHAIHDTLQAVNRYLRIPMPEVFRSNQSTGLRIADVNPPALIVGEDLYQGGRSSQELAYMLGKYACYFHPLHKMAALYPDPLRLKVLYLAAEFFCAPETYAGLRSEAVESAAKVIQSNTNPAMKRQLQQALEDARVAEGGQSPNLDRWLMSVEYSAVNLGFTVCNDIEVAASLERDPMLSMSALTHQDKVRSLVMYAISRKYETITERLGIQIQSSL